METTDNASMACRLGLRGGARTSRLEVSEFRLEHAKEAFSLMLSIQREEFGVALTAEQQPNLRDIPVLYQRGNGNFWVALDSRRVVGTMALLDIGEGQAVLRKLFVAQSFRGRETDTAAATALLATLLAWAESKGLREVFLGTTAQFLAAHRFYEKNGFVEVPRASLPERFPVMHVDAKFYRRSIKAL